MNEVFNKIITLLEQERHPYLVIGGIAAAVLGYPRMTSDIDISLSIRKKDVPGFIKCAEEFGFTSASDGSLKHVRDFGVFKLYLKESHIDFIIMSTAFERDALARAQKIKVYGKEAFFPTPEDLILLKIVPGRAIDIADIESLVKRHKTVLDKKYLESWAQKLSDEAEDMRIYETLNKIVHF